ncbi:MAG: TIGR01777 family protein [Actinobacteria bacterium]|nr:TIGR01777 family protein [Actinomycetota bacterium]
MRVAITGASGLIGSALAGHLSAAGHTVVAVVRRTPKDGEIFWDPPAGRLDPDDFIGIDAVVNLAGAGIQDHRWTAEYKRTLLASRTRSTALLATTLARLERKPAVLLSGSAVGFYGERGDEELAESSNRGSGFLAELCVEWEAATAAAEAAGIRVAHLRTGIVLSPRGGALKKQLPLFKLGLGGKFGSGRAWQSWISIDDEVAAIEHLLTNQSAGTVRGPVNLTAPLPVTNADFTKVLASVLRRPAVMRIPAFAPRLLLGGELANALLFSGQRVLPTELLKSGYEFRHPTLEVALRSLLRRER